MLNTVVSSCFFHLHRLCPATQAPRHFRCSECSCRGENPYWDDVTLSLSRNAPMHDNAIASASIVCVEQSVWSRLSCRWAVMSCAIIVTVWLSLRSSADWITATQCLLVDFRMLLLYTSRPHWWHSTRGVCTRGREAKLPLFWTKGNFTTVGATFKFSSSGLSGISPTECLSVCQTQRLQRFAHGALWRHYYHNRGK